MGGPSRLALAWMVLALLTGSGVQQVAAQLKMPVIPWNSIMRGGYVDMVTRQGATNSAPADEFLEAGPAQQASSSPQPQPRGSGGLSFNEKCSKGSDSLSQLVTKCTYVDPATSCAALASMGALPRGAQGFETPKLGGTYMVPTGCTSGSLATTFDMSTNQLTFSSPQVTILAVITKDPSGSMVSYFGTGTTQGRMKHRTANRAEFCYAPAAGSGITVSQNAVYSTGMQPGTASWTFSKSVQVAGPYTNGRAVMLNGDRADATWTLSVRKSGSDVNYQGVVSGNINIQNPTAAAVQINSVFSNVNGGPPATVACPQGVPFMVQGCSTVTCQYTAYYPSSPPAGTYSTLAQVQFQVMGSQGYPSSAQGTAAFNVGNVGSLSALATSAGAIPSGSALVTDPGSPLGSYMFGGPGSQTYQTTLTCGGPASSGISTTTATLTGSNGQQVSHSATAQKQCFDLVVAVNSKSSPYVGRWGWSVSKSANPTTLGLKVDQRVIDGTAQGAGGPRILGFGRDYAATTTKDVTYSVTYTRSPPSGYGAGKPAFEANGEVTINNPAPINAQLQGVYVSISNSLGGPSYVTPASCPVLNIPAGQTVTCSWRATPTFNPVGQQVRGTARYVNLKNGKPSAHTTDFNSPQVTINAGAADNWQDGLTARKLLQTWGGGFSAPLSLVGVVPEMQPATVNAMYAVDGTPIIVPGSVANGTGVIVSGKELVAGGPGAVSASGAVPVILPSTIPTTADGLMVNNAAFVNEAGPSGAAMAAGAAAAQLVGLQDACVDVGDVFVAGDYTVKGKLVSGAQPSGRICSTATFTYTMRYGPFPDCVSRKSVNAATFKTVDTETRGGAQADIDIVVDGCPNPSPSVKVLPVKVVTSATGGYTWSASARADKSELALAQGTSSTVTYMVSYKRAGAKAGATLVADLAITNPTPYPVPIEGVTYTATTMCDGIPKTTSGGVSCNSTIVAPRGRVACQVAGSMACAGNGAFTVLLTAGGGFTITSAATPFMFNSSQLAAASSTSQCAQVKDAFAFGTGKLTGVLVSSSGARPSGLLCGSKTFQYTMKFGPYSKCGQYKAISTASFTSNSVPAAGSASVSLPISVVGCSVYKEMARVADCVNTPPYWTQCDPDSDIKCANGWKLLPGGKGKETLFFPKPNERSTRTYTDMLSAPAPATLAASRRAYVGAAQQYLAAQLNYLSGARMSNPDLQEVYDALGVFLADTPEGTTLPFDQVAEVQKQAGVLARYNNGTLPSTFKAPRRCTA